MKHRVATALLLLSLLPILTAAIGTDRPECETQPNWNGEWWVAKVQPNNRVGTIKASTPKWMVQWDYYRGMKRFVYGPDLDSHATPGYPFARISQVYDTPPNYILYWHRDYPDGLYETDQVNALASVKWITVCFADNEGISP